MKEKEQLELLAEALEATDFRAESLRDRVDFASLAAEFRSTCRLCKKFPCAVV